MTYDAAGLKSLALMTFQMPRAAARALISDPPPRQAVWLLIWLQGILVTLLLAVSAMTTGATLPQAGPFGLVLLPPMVVLSVLISTVVLSEAGRVFGGRGRFWDVLLTSVWLSVVNMGLTAVQVLVALVMPPLAGMVQIVFFLWLLWVAVAMLQEVHGFATPWPAIGAYVLAAVMTAGLVLVLGAIAVGLGGAG